ncbi:MAG: glycoside hydrolase family 18 protein [Deltaproteobacteria bacterium]|nr:glycoside hydrolase family 18 protein [Deltaproteobacteria bacterium]
MPRAAILALALAFAAACGRPSAATPPEAGRVDVRAPERTEEERPDAGETAAATTTSADTSASTSPTAATETDAGRRAPTTTSTMSRPSTRRPGKKLRKDTWVIGYYATYLFRRCRPELVRYDALTHLAVTRVMPDAAGDLVLELGREGEAGLALLDELVRRARVAGTRTLLMVGGGGAREALLAATTDDLRPAFVAGLVDFARAHQLDGLDLDWEPLPASDHASFLALAADLRAAWPEAVLTAAVAHLPGRRDSADELYARAAGHFDRLNVMTYSMTAAQGGWKSWHSAALYGERPETPSSIDHSVRGYLAAGVPPGRLGIGIGFFGVCYTPPVDGPRQELRRSTIAAADCTMSYADIMRRYFDPAARRWDEEARVPYLALPEATGPHGCGYVSYEDAQSIAERAAYVAERGLGGVIVWAVNEGYLKHAPEGERDPLMDALAKHFLGR